MSFHHGGFGSQKPVENTQRNDYDFPTQFVPRDGISNLSINGKNHLFNLILSLF